MLMVFPGITSAMRRLEEIEYDDEHWEEADRLGAYLREHDGYRRYELQTEILRYFGFRDEQLEQ